MSYKESVSDALTAGAVTSPKLAAPDADGLAPQMTIRKLFAAAGPGVADDVVIYSANAPFGFRVVDVKVLISTPIAAATVTARNGLAGGGSALSDDLAAATVGTRRDLLLTATETVPINGTLVLRRSDNGVAGEVIVTIAKT